MSEIERNLRSASSSGGTANQNEELHKKPALYPLFALLCFLAALTMFVFLARSFRPFLSVLLSMCRHPHELFEVALALPGAVALLAVLEHRRRLRAPAVPTYLRINRAIAYGVILTLALHLYLCSADAGGSAHASALLFDEKTQALAVLAAAVFGGLSYLGWLRPLVDTAGARLETYRAAVERLKETYDFILGVDYPDDWKRAEQGRKEWLVLKEHSLWTNLFVFGGIGAGKTSALGDPLVLQAMKKFPDDEALRPSLMVLDLKGDNALRLYDYAKKLGREREMFIISPGNQILQAATGHDGGAPSPVLGDDGLPVIPKDRFLTWNPLGGTGPADLRASLLLDGLASTNDGPKMGGSVEYFENVESEFLSATVQLFDLVKGPGNVTLLDVYLFAYDEDKRKELCKSRLAAGSTAQLYFKKRFSKMKPEDQGHLISGLTAKLSKLTSPSVRNTFCVDEPGSRSGSVGAEPETRAFPGFLELLVNRPGIIVFSVPEAIYSRELCRVLGIMFLRAFHHEMLARSTPQFVGGGGNNKRLVMNVVDECWAFMCKGVANFTAVSRQARTCSVYLTQSLDQIPEDYRATVEGNFRTKALLSVNDSLTLKRFEDLFGTQKEHIASTSVSSSLQGVRHGVLFQGVAGKDQGMSVSSSVNEQVRPRFSQHEIQHLPRGRAVVHLYAEGGQEEARAMEVAPAFELRFSLFSPESHADVVCAASAGGMHAYAYEEEAGGGVCCGRCGHRTSRENYEAFLASVGAASREEQHDQQDDAQVST